MTGAGKVAVLGAGAWGTALALVAARAGNDAVLWGRNGDRVARIDRTGSNPFYLPGIAFAPAVAATTDLGMALDGAETVVLAVPAQQTEEMASAIAPLVRPRAVVVSSAKGIDRTSMALPSETVARRIGDAATAVLSGPSFASDVARGLPTAVTVASADIDLAALLCQRLSSENFRCYASGDPKGVELGGALKNVIALAVGATRGMGLGASAEAALIARGFAEMSRLASALGADARTLTGLSGLGDLVLTCSSEQSRNLSYGIALGRGDDLAGRPLAEGAFTASVAARIADRLEISAPIIRAVAQVLDGAITPGEAVRQLLDRPLRSEAG